MIRFMTRLFLTSLISTTLRVGCSALCLLSPVALAGDEPASEQPEAAAFISGDSGILPAGNGPSTEQLKQAEADGSHWLYHTRDYAGTRYSPLARINRDNVSELRPVCINQLGGESDFQTGPLVFGGVMYISSGADTLALDAATCRQLWHHTWQHRDLNLSSTNRGVAIQGGYVVRGTSDGYLLALDAYNGALLWARQIADPSQGEHFTMAPMIFDDLILIGPAGGNNGLSGWIGGFSLLDGSEQWRFHTVPGALEDTESPLGVRIGGGAVWTPLSLDVDSETLFVAVTNPAPNVAATLRPGDNLYTNAIVALDVRSGELQWYRQLIAVDDHSWDLTQVSPLLQGTVNGEERALVATVGKDGLLRVLDRQTQEILYSTAVTTRLNADARVTMGGTYTCPGVLGGVLWNGPAYSPEQGILVTPAVNLCSTFYRASEVRYTEGRDYFDGTAVSDPSSLGGWLTAVDVSTGEVRWRHRTPLPMVAAVTTTAGGLVLTGEMSGDFLILGSDDGEVLYRFNTGGAMGGGVITYEVAGRQYIAVASGHPSEYQVNGDMGSPTIVVFSLPDQ